MTGDTEMPEASMGMLAGTPYSSPTRASGGSPAQMRRRADSGVSRSLHDFPSPRARSSREHVVYSDRFIPSRALSSRRSFNVLEREAATSESSHFAEREDSNPAYQQVLQSELLGIPPGSQGDLSSSRSGTASAPGLGAPLSSPHKRMFRYMSGDRFSPLAGAPIDSPYASSPVGGASTESFSGIEPRRAPRKIARSPYKVLDAPALQDDFYLNLVDWSAQNVLAVGLGTCVYLWSAATSRVVKLCELGTGAAPDSVCSVAWSGRGSYLAIGTNSNETQIWDANKSQLVRTMQGHRGRVGCMSWSSHLLSTGSRDRTILNRDVRAPEDFQSRLNAHRSEVCGLKWAPDDRLLASGGNDNMVGCWNANSPNPVQRFESHTAAVKALAWSPHQHGLLASGGGTADQHIRFWNTSSGAQLTSVNTGSQVCNLVWSRNVNEIVSTHGYSQNQVCVWRWPTLAKAATLTGHTTRVLYLAASPDGQTIVTGAGDETLRFWNVFPSAHVGAAAADSSVSSMMRAHIR
mmetsp:Transcript_11708/g.35139  ORF Transcript_11708/g.35139 Transcript_11708/m.35139 type:complete len:520 (+) Transcript_11708:546-2105(+)